MIKQLLKATVVTAAISQVSMPAVAGSSLEDTFTLLAGVLGQPNFTESDAYTVNDDIRITTHDGMELEANVIVPTSGEGPFPAIIFINSWAMNEYEYLPEAQRLAEAGYVVLSYATRGFGTSDDLINTAGPKDIADYSTVIDWVIDNTPADPERIGTAGISYGSGISLIGAAHDPRVKAIAAMSTWGSLEASLYGNETPRLIWGEVLNLSSQLLGRPDPIINEHFNNLLQHKNVDEIRAWAAVRSPITYVDQLNENGTAVYISKNWGDDMFHANSVMDLFEQLQGPKHIDLMPGTHASTEVFGMIGMGDNRTFDNVKRWFDQYLKGEDSGIAAEKPVQMEVKLTGAIDGFDAYPVPEADNVKFYLHPREFLSGGELESYPFQSWWTYTNRIDSLADTLATTGVPIFAQILEDFKVPVVTSVPLIAAGQGIWFETGRLDEKMQIRGDVNLQLQIEPQYNKAQLVAYLYDMDAWGIGKLITHAPVTLPHATAGQATTVNFDLVTTAYDIPAGHKLVLAVDTQDLFYAEPTLWPYAVEFKYKTSKQSVLTVPVL